MRALEAGGPLNRAQLAQDTGLSRATLTRVLSRLRAEGLVVASHAPAAGGGRPPELLAVAPRSLAGLSIDLGHAHARVLVGDTAGTLSMERAITFDHGTVERGVAGALAATRSLVDEVLGAVSLPAAGLDAVVVGVPSSVDLRGRPAARRFQGHDVTAVLGVADLAPTVMVRNDADLGAIGAALFAAHSRLTDLIYLKVSHGLGAGLVLAGKLFRGGGTAGNLGHVRVRDSGEVCICGGRGCLETIVSVRALLGALQPAHPDRQLGLQDLQQLLLDDDPGACGLLADAGREIGRVAADLVAMTHPQAVFVGGDLATGEALLSGIRESIRRRSPPRTVQGLVIGPVPTGVRTEALGGLALATRAFGEHHTSQPV